MLGPAAMAIASLVLGLADLLAVHLASLISYVRHIGSAREDTFLTTYRVDAAIHLAIGLLALALAIAAIRRLRTVVWIDATDDDDELLDAIDAATPTVEPWIK